MSKILKKGNNNNRAQFTKEKAEHASFLLYEGTVPRILWYNLWKRKADFRMTEYESGQYLAGA